MMKRDGKLVPPTIRHWLEDYRAQPALSGLRSSLDEINYINKSDNARLLLAEDREMTCAQSEIAS